MKTFHSMETNKRYGCATLKHGWATGCFTIIDYSSHSLLRRSLHTQTLFNDIISCTDLSDCQLQQVPDAIFMLMQNTSLVSCNLSHNVINKIPAKLAIKWTLLTGEDIISYIQEKGKWNIRFSKSACWLTGFIPQSAVTFEIGSEGLTPRFSFTTFEWTFYGLLILQINLNLSKYFPLLRTERVPQPNLQPARRALPLHSSWDRWLLSQLVYPGDIRIEIPLTPEKHLNYLSFQMPPVLAEIPSLIKIVASKNFIADVEVEALQYLPNLEHVNVEGNPLKKEVHDQLSKVTSIRVILSPREQEEWEDLSCWSLRPNNPKIMYRETRTSLNHMRLTYVIFCKYLFVVLFFHFAL